MPSFYQYLGGPRTFWGGGRTTIVNNNIIGGMPMMRAPHHHCCGGGGNMFQWMAGFNVANSFMSNLFGGGAMNFGGLGGGFGMFGGMNNMYGMGGTGGIYPGYSGNYNYNNLYTSNMDLSAKVKSLEDELEVAKKQIKELEESKSDKADLSHSKTPTDEELEAANKKKTSSDADTATKKKTDDTTAADKKKPADAANKQEETSETALKKGASIEKSDKDFDKTLDNILKSSGFNKLEPQEKNYIKNNINEIYLDDNGNVRYNITAVAHDTDRVSTITSRFYANGETPDLKVGRAKFNTQKSETNSITEPHSGDTIIANGVSEYGLKALIKEAKNGITKQGEITKTNKRISDLKSDFISGKNKLSKAYVLQNHLMSEAEYDKVISEKYKV